MTESGTATGFLQSALKAIGALAVTLALFSLVAFGFDASAVRVFLGLTPQLDVPYVGTRSAMVAEMLDMAEVGPSDYVIDLGTGDGRILIAAARDRGASGLGVDLDPALIDTANEEASDEGLASRVRFAEQDLFDTPLHEADVVTMFLLPSVNLRLRPRLLAQLKPGSRVVSNRFDMGEWRPDAVERVNGYSAYMWVVPAPVSGSWQIEFNGRTAQLELEQSFQDVTGTATIDGELQAITASLRGRHMRFGIELPEGRRVFEGEVEGDRFAPDDGSEWLANRLPD